MENIFSTKIFRSIFLIAFTFFFLNCSAQQFIYSAPVGNYAYSDTKIIGRVKNNIIIYNYTWSHTFDLRNSELLVYNDKMQLQNRTSFKSITPKIAAVDFIREKDLFSAILQYRENGFLVCKLVNFDADGNMLSEKIIEHSPDKTEGNYENIKSTIEGSMVLVKIEPSDIAGTIAIRYHFIKNGSLIHSDKIILPFNTLYSELGKALLDNDNLIIPKQDSTQTGERLALYKVNLNNNASINTLRNLDKGYLFMPGINIIKNDKYYTVISEWKDSNQNFYGIDKFFLWQLNNDFTDKSTDTVLAGIDTINSCLQNINFYKLNSIALKNNTSNIIISAEYMMNQQASFSFSPSGGFPASTESFYEGRVLSITPLKELNGNGYYSEANVTRGPTDNSKGNTISNPQQAKFNSQPAKLAVLNIDAQSKLRWTQCFSELTEKDFFSLTYESLFINTQNTLHIIYAESVKKNKQALHDIILNPDGTYTTKPIISMNLKYTYFLNQSFQLDSNSAIVPCNIKGKQAFAKLTVE